MGAAPAPEEDEGAGEACPLTTPRGHLWEPMREPQHGETEAMEP